jgi:hypothetical protein
MELVEREDALATLDDGLASARRGDGRLVLVAARSTAAAYAPLRHRRLEEPVDTYVILRRNGWRSPEDLGAAAERSRQVGDEQMSDDIRWIRSYVLEEGGGSVGTVCIYQATSPEAIREHASRADLPVDEIIKVADTVLVRPDPQPVSV